VSEPRPSYTLQYDPRAAKELAKLDRPVARRIASAVEALGDQPRPHGARQLVGYPGPWRVRIGDYRVVYDIKTRNSWFSRCGSPIAATSTGTCERDLAAHGS
jgi:mRNA interferase RelE/StbE